METSYRPPFGVITKLFDQYYKILPKIEGVTDYDEIVYHGMSLRTHASKIVENFWNYYICMYTINDKSTNDIIKKDLSIRRGITHKLKKWPKIVFKKNFDTNNSAIIDTYNLIDDRNRITHLDTDFKKIPLNCENTIFIDGLIDVSNYEYKSEDIKHDCKRYVEIAANFIEYVFKFSGKTGDDLLVAKMRWTGVYPQEFLER